MIFRKQPSQKKPSLFGIFSSQKKKKSAAQIIGLAQFDSQEYYFIRRKKEIFLVSRGLKKTYTQKISFPKELAKVQDTFRDLHAIKVDRNTYALACT